MLSKKKIVAFKASLYLLIFLFTQSIQAQEYIEFVANPGWDTEFTSNFNNWEFIEFSMPNDDISQLEASLEIDLKDISSFTEQISESLQEEEYFHTEKYPIAILAIAQVSRIDNNNFEANAILTLKGVTKTIPFTFEIDSNSFVKGSLTLNRLDFGVTGDGPADEVQIRFAIQLPSN